MGPFWLVSIISVCNKISYGNFSNSSGNYTLLLEVLSAVPAIIHHCLTFNNSFRQLIIHYYSLFCRRLRHYTVLAIFITKKKCGADYSAPHQVNTFIVLSQISSNPYLVQSHHTGIEYTLGSKPPSIPR